MAKSKQSGCLAGILKLFQKKTYEDEMPYRVRDDFLSGAESSFYRVLHNVVEEDYLIFPKVSLRDIFFVSKPNENMAYYNKIDRKHVDFLLCSTSTLRPSLAIELDDGSHQRADRIERDNFVDLVFVSAGLRLVRIRAQHAYSTQELHDLIYQGRGRQVQMTRDGGLEVANVPRCPKCGVDMVLRRANKGAHIGEEFYGCINYPKCREVVRA
jgi:hypothetical protein